MLEPINNELWVDWKLELREKCRVVFVKFQLSFLHLSQRLFISGRVLIYFLLLCCKYAKDLLTVLKVGLFDSFENNSGYLVKLQNT